MNGKNIEDVTETEFLEFVRKICTGDYKTEAQHGRAVFQFNQMSEHPSGSDLIYYPEASADDSPEGITREVKEWRAANGKPGFKTEN
ncbi:bacteriocin immunity protein [Pseudomonas sp. RC10]|uniref:bacteriocin immunity protein n=1 Tax=Pseudomonas bambusae TaxID=3139142 RepID=UPI0031397DD0